jgi:hypothetical protein
MRTTLTHHRHRAGSPILGKLLLVCILAGTLGACRSAPQTVALFNGNDLQGWHADVPAMDNDTTLTSPFIVRDGLLVSLGEPRGHLITDATYQDYRLRVEYRFPGEPGNCGVLVHASTPRALYDMFPQSVEVQMMHEHAGDFWCIREDITVNNMVERRGPREEWGVTEGENRRILNLTDGSENPLGEWNTMTIEALDDGVKVWVNGELVNAGYGATARQGHIALQAEGAEVEFRTVELTRITAFTGEPPQEVPGRSPTT